MVYSSVGQPHYSVQLNKFAATKSLWNEGNTLELEATKFFLFWLKLEVLKSIRRLSEYYPTDERRRNGKLPPNFDFKTSSSNQNRKFDFKSSSFNVFP